jgi:hypothetical protein
LEVVMASVAFAADYPFLDILWSMLVFVGFFFWIWLAVMVFSDVFRRRDMGGFAKAMWIVAVILVPMVGVLIYLIAYHRSIADRNLQMQEASQDMFDQQVRAAVGPSASGPATEIAAAKDLLDSGTISRGEFEDIKSKALVTL